MARSYISTTCIYIGLHEVLHAGKYAEDLRGDLFFANGFGTLKNNRVATDTTLNEYQQRH